MAKAEFFKLFADYIRAAYPDGIKVQSDSQLQLDSLLQYIHTHIAAPLPNRKLSAFVHMHPNHFIRFFKMQTGFTPASYIRKERMDLAKRLLEESELTISEVGEKAGFDDLAHFSKNFKQYFSMTPSAYRDFFKRNPVTYSTTLFS